MREYIAKDTGKPLVVMGGYRVAADGSIISKPLGPRQSPPSATEDDRRLLVALGAAGLADRKLYGVMDRLRTSGLVD